MALTRLQLSDFRCFAQVELALSSEKNLITGANASGKTSLLEAFFYLSQGRSFRTARAESMVRSGAEGMFVAGRVARPGVAERPLGIRRQEGRVEARLDRKPVKRIAELTRALPVLLVDSGVHRLVEDGPGQRRRYLDWGVFHVEQQFFEAWRRYRRALRQRNELLKSRADKRQVATWTAELATTGELLQVLRQRYFDRLRLVAEAMAGQILGGHRVEMKLRPGWRGDSLADNLEASLERDRQLGSTQVGPHRAEIRIDLDGMKAQERASRGQQKGLATALILAQAQVFRGLVGEACSLLLDDLAAELDPHHLGRVLEVLDDIGGQQIFTAIGVNEPDNLSRDAGAVFHVEQGRVDQVV